MAQRAGRATAVAVTVVTGALVLAGCGRLESRRHAFPDSLYEPTPTATAAPISPNGTVERTAPPTGNPSTGALDTSRDPFGDLTATQLMGAVERPGPHGPPVGRGRPRTGALLGAGPRHIV